MLCFFFWLAIGLKPVYIFLVLLANPPFGFQCCTPTTVQYNYSKKITSVPITFVPDRQNTTHCIPTKLLLMNKLQGYITEKVVSLRGLKVSIIQLAFDECLIVLSAFWKITMSDIILVK